MRKNCLDWLYIMNSMHNYPLINYIWPFCDWFHCPNVNPIILISFYKKSYFLILVIKAAAVNFPITQMATPKKFSESSLEVTLLSNYITTISSGLLMNSYRTFWKWTGVFWWPNMCLLNIYMESYVIKPVYFFVWSLKTILLQLDLIFKVTKQLEIAVFLFEPQH